MQVPTNISTNNIQAILTAMTGVKGITLKEGLFISKYL